MTYHILLSDFNLPNDACPATLDACHLHPASALQPRNWGICMLVYAQNMSKNSFFHAILSIFDYIFVSLYIYIYLYDIIARIIILYNIK